MFFYACAAYDRGARGCFERKYQICCVEPALNFLGCSAFLFAHHDETAAPLIDLLLPLQVLQQLNVTLETAKSGAASPRATSLLLKTNRLAHKPKYRSMEETTFDSVLRLKTGSAKQYRMQQHLRSFEEEAVRQHLVAEKQVALDRMGKELLLSEMRAAQLGSTGQNRAYLQDWERQGRINHAKNMAVQRERELRAMHLQANTREMLQRRRREESLASSQVRHAPCTVCTLGMSSR